MSQQLEPGRDKMAGIILLEGGAEFGGKMSEPDLRAIELAGGLDASICVIPAAAAPDHNQERAGRNAEGWFRSLGARQVNVLPLIDRPSANQPEIASELRKARFIYMLGGFTHYLGQTLLGSLCWEAILNAYNSGAVVGGSSAGAMVLCQTYYDPSAGRVREGLNLVSNACLIPHHDSFGKGWAPKLRQLLPEATLTGIDERTGMLDDGGQGRWRVYGQGTVTIYQQETSIYRRGEVFSF
jgi:cyanophycinase